MPRTQTGRKAEIRKFNEEVQNQLRLTGQAVVDLPPGHDEAYRARLKTAAAEIGYKVSIQLVPSLDSVGKIAAFIVGKVD